MASNGVRKSDDLFSDEVDSDTKRASRLPKVMVVVRRTEERLKPGKMPRRSL
jgi:hypothetical protein